MAKRKKTKKIMPNKKAISAFFIALFSFIYLSIVTSGFGYLGQLLTNVSFKLFGLASYILYPIAIINIIYFLLNKLDKGNIRSFALIYLSILSFLTVVNIHIGSFSTLSESINYNLQIAELKYGVGAIGAFFHYILNFLIGELGIYLLFFFSIFLTILSMIRLPISVFLKELLLMIERIFLYIKSGIIKLYRKIKEKNIEASEKNTSNNFKDLNFSNENESSVQINDDRHKNPVKDNSRLKISNYKDNEEDVQIKMDDYGIKTEEVSNYRFPPLELLKENSHKSTSGEIEVIEDNARKIESTLKSFNIDSKVVEVNRGPRVTSYELKPSGGVKVSSIVNLQDNLALSLASSGIRIEAPIPGKAVVGIEVPNSLEDDVGLKEILQSKEFKDANGKIPFALGKDIQGRSIVTSIEKMPHLLIAGATGSGKSVCINTLIMSILYSRSPDDVKLLLIDPKMVELNVYNGIPHLVIPVVTDPRKASAALNWAVREMERRYEIFSKKSVRDIEGYKENYSGEDDEKLPYIVIVIDELSDLMMVAANEVEDYISRLAQMSRACGIHLVIATQRPSVDVITGTIKANIPSRISFSVSSQIDSRTILDMSGAEKLLGKGDMLFYPSSFRKPIRVQGAFISDSEVENIVSFIKENSDENYSKDIMEDIMSQKTQSEQLDSHDELLSEAIDLVILEGQASVSLIQRRLQVGYARAGRIIDQMEELGVIEGHQGSKPRRVLTDTNVLKKDEQDEHS